MNVMAGFIDEKCLIQKKILHAGKGGLLDYLNDSKVSFHFRTAKQDDDQTVLDDSRQLGRPMELIIGKKFKLEVWEECVKTMQVGEVAAFSVDKSLVAVYPWVSKILRRALSDEKRESEIPHVCGGMMAFHKDEESSPHMDSLMKNPEPLTFTIELLKVEHPGEYTQESWTMNDNEKLNSVPQLKECGNKLYEEQNYEAAAEKYSQALGLLEQLILKEKPGDEEWKELDDMKIPLLLNFCQCKLFLNDFYPVIEHATTVLEKDNDNVKALFRRGKAHVGAWNPKDARNDFERVATLDPKLSSAIKKELQNLDLLEQQHVQEAKTRFFGKLFH